MVRDGREISIVFGMHSSCMSFFESFRENTRSSCFEVYSLARLCMKTLSTKFPPASSTQNCFSATLDATHATFSHNIAQQRSAIRTVESHHAKKNELLSLQNHLAQLEAENASLKSQLQEVNGRVAASAGGGTAGGPAAGSSGFPGKNDEPFDQTRFEALMLQWRGRKLKCLDVTDGVAGAERRTEFWDSLNILGDADELGAADWEFLRGAGNVPVPMD